MNIQFIIGTILMAPLAVATLMGLVFLMLALFKEWRTYWFLIALFLFVFGFGLVVHANTATVSLTVPCTMQNMHTTPCTPDDYYEQEVFVCEIV
jgi:hypothetical protein